MTIFQYHNICYSSFALDYQKVLGLGHTCFNVALISVTSVY